MLISKLHSKATVSKSAFSHKRPAISYHLEMSPRWWSLPGSTWNPPLTTDTEYRTILNGLLLHNINLLTSPESVGGDPQNEQVEFCTIHVSCRKSTLLRLIKKSSCCFCLTFTTRIQPSQWLTGNFDKYYTILKKQFMLKHMPMQTFTHNFFFYSIFCTKHFKNINPCKLSALTFP